jgi:hypothetical protein
MGVLVTARRWWALAGVWAFAGCGARTLPVDDGPAPHAAGSAQDAGTTEPGVQIHICPFSPPPADSECNEPGQICVYEDLPGCPSIVCRSGHWQAGAVGC